jgi:hypothetical protein
LRHCDRVTPGSQELAHHDPFYIGTLNPEEVGVVFFIVSQALASKPG